MAKQWQIRRGTEAENDTFTGALAEVTMDTTNNTVRIHDGVTPGGVELAKKEDIYHPTLFTHEWDDHIRNSISWLRADTFSWHSGELYVAAYQHLEDEYDPDELPTITVNDNVYVRSAADDDLNAIHPYCWRNDELSVNVTIFTTNEEPVIGDFTFGTSTAVIEDSSITAVGTVLVLSTETIDNITITYYRAEDGHKICLPDQESNIEDVYAATGVAWYYILDTENKRFKLPRTKWGFVGLRGEVGDYIAPGLPDVTTNLNGMVGHDGNVSANGASSISRTSGLSYTGGGDASYNMARYNITVKASNSNAVYGASSTVQPAATEMYLYFYVGTFDSITHDNPQDLVHKSGDETISGTKTFTTNPFISNSNTFLHLQNTDIDLSGENTSYKYAGLCMNDVNGNELGYVRSAVTSEDSKNISRLELIANDPNLEHTHEAGNRINSYIVLDTDGETQGARLNFNPSHSDNSTQLITSKWYNDQRTNCITEIPQDIKLELNNGTLTLKSGSIITAPDGTQVQTVEDKSQSAAVTGGANKVLVCCNNTNGTLRFRDLANCVSGPDATTTAGFAYDTTTNKICYYSSTGVLQHDDNTLPIAIISTDSDGKIVSIDQVFNGFGFIGSTVFALPGVKVLSPNGRNSDRTLNNQIGAVRSVQIITQSGTYKRNVFVTLSGELLITVNSYAYDVENNYNIINSSISGAAHVGVADMISDKIKTLSVKQPFRVVDYGDTEFIAHQSMPSDRYIDLTLGASESTYIAPADGYIYLSKTATAVNQIITIINDSNGMRDSDTSVSASGWISTYLPVSKGQLIRITYTAGGTTNAFRFFYANGSK